MTSPVRKNPGTGLLTRRQLLARGSLACLTFSLAQSLWTRQLLADPAASEYEAWVEDLLGTAAKLKHGELTIPQWQLEMDRLYGSVSLDQLLAHLDFDRLAASLDIGESGERFIDVDCASGTGVDTSIVSDHGVRTRFAGVRGGCSIPPHGHENTSSTFLVLNGEFHVRQYDKLEVLPDRLVFRQSRDERQVAGQWTGITETVRNMHWLEATSGDAYIFSTKVKFVQADKPMRGRVCVDLRAPVEHGGGVVEAPIISNRQARQIYNGA